MRKSEVDALSEQSRERYVEAWNNLHDAQESAGDARVAFNEALGEAREIGDVYSWQLARCAATLMFDAEERAVRAWHEFQKVDPKY